MGKRKKKTQRRNVTNGELRTAPTLRSFLALPTRTEWKAELAAGWDGPDGSSCSTDTIFGVRIGETSRAHVDATYPANLHDWRYRLARRLYLPNAWRRAADRHYRDGCIDRTDDELTKRSLRLLARWRARRRYSALRLFGKAAWTAEPESPAKSPSES